MKKQLLILMTLFTVAIGYSQTFTHNNIHYSVTSTSPNEVVVTGYVTTSGTDVTIPSIVTPSSSGKTSSADSTTNKMVTYSVTSIGYQAFYNNGITSVSIPNSVISIGVDAFRNNLLSTVILPDGLTTIKNSCFSYNQLTNELIIPDSVLTIEATAFKWNSLNSVVFGNSVTTIGFDSFGQNNLTSINISDSVTVIEARAFDANQLTNITIPSNVTTIGFKAFNANSLTDVTSLTITPPTITTGGVNDTFNNDRSTIHLHIPAGTMGAYVTDAGALWTGFNPVTEDAGLSVSDFELTNDITVITTTDEIRVTYSNNIKLQNYTIYSMSGAIVTTGKESEIPTTYLASGIYILKLDFDKGIIAKKVLVN